MDIAGEGRNGLYKHGHRMESVRGSETTNKVRNPTKDPTPATEPAPASRNGTSGRLHRRALPQARIYGRVRAMPQNVLP